MMLNSTNDEDDTETIQTESLQPPSIAIPNLNKNSFSSIFNEKYTDADFEADLKEEEEREKKAAENNSKNKKAPSKASSKKAAIIDRDAHLNEDTDGFVTQVNVDEVIKRSAKAQRNKRCNVKILNPLQMIPSNIFQAKSNKRNSRKPQSKSPQRGSVSPSYYHPTSSKSNSYQASDESRSGRSNSTMFPNINSQKNRFPNRGNLSSRRIYVRYMSSRLEKESLVIPNKQSLDENANKQSTPSLKSSLSRASKMNQSTVVEESVREQETENDDYQPIINQNLADNSLKPGSRENTQSALKESGEKVEKQVFFDLNKASTPPPSQMDNRLIKNSRQSYRSNSRQKRTPNQTLKNVNSTLTGATSDYASIAPDVSLPNTKQSKRTNLRSSKEQQQKLKSGIVDLNHFGITSVLSSHYLSQSKRYLSDMNLYNAWPTSKMYKISIKANPWVNSFKEKLIANEINSNYFRSNTTALSTELTHTYQTAPVSGVSPSAAAFSNPTTEAAPSAFNNRFEPSRSLAPGLVSHSPSNSNRNILVEPVMPAFQNHLHVNPHNSYNLFPKIKHAI